MRQHANRTALMLTALAALAAALAWAAPARVEAHARLESSTPARREQLAESPASVEITFSQEIQKVSGTYDITVVRDRGQSVTAGPAAVDGEDRRILSVPLQPDLASGRYVVNWRNVSDADGDPAEGAFSFYLNHEPNDVDRDNDDRLDEIGQESATPSATSGAATPATTAAATAAATARATAAPTGTAEDGAPDTPEEDDDGGGGRGVAILIIAGVAAAALAIVGGGYLLVRRS